MPPLLEPGDTIWVHDYQLIPVAGLSAASKGNGPDRFLPAHPLSRRPRSSRRCRTTSSSRAPSSPTTWSASRRCATARISPATPSSIWAAAGSMTGASRALAARSRSTRFRSASTPRAFAAEAERNFRSPELRSLATDCRQPVAHRRRRPARLHEGPAGAHPRHRDAAGGWPAYRGRVQFLQIAPPTREGVEAYDAIRSELERLTGHVNGRFGDLSWSPDPLRPPAGVRAAFLPACSAAAASGS